MCSAWPWTSREDVFMVYCVCVCRNVQKEAKKDGEVDEKFWELLLSADKKDYERICIEYGVTDFRGMLKKLNEKKREIEEQQSQVHYKWTAKNHYVSCIKYTDTPH